MAFWQRIALTAQLRVARLLLTIKPGEYAWGYATQLRRKEELAAECTVTSAH